MAPRLELQELLVALLGSNNVYFDPKPNIELQYPCIVYTVDDIVTYYADGKPFFLEDRYMLTIIDRDADSEIKDKVKVLPKCRFSRTYTADNLHHFIFNLSF